MALASSGTISIGGSTANRSINLELGRSATATSSLGESTLRGLAGVSSGAISMSNFYGKSSTWTATLTVGYWEGSTCYKGCSYWDLYGYGKYDTYTSGGTTYTKRIPDTNQTSTAGSLTDTTFDKLSNATILGLYHNGSGTGWLHFSIAGHHSNAGWSTLTIGSSSYSRSSAYHAQGYQDSEVSGTTFPYTNWYWINQSANPFGTTTGATRSISIS